METHGFIGKCANANGIAASLAKCPCLHPVRAPLLMAVLFQFHF